jgi:hypothetical protein
MSGDTDTRTNAQKMAGNMVKAYLFTCIHCAKSQAIFDPDEPMLGQADAVAQVRAKGWVQRRGAWVCPGCAATIKAPKPKLNIRRGNLTLIK